MTASEKWPTQREVPKFFGDPRPGTGPTFQRWYRENIVFIRPRWAMRMGSIDITKIACHRLVAPTLERIFDELNVELSRNEIVAAGLNVFSGSFNYRAMRGGTELSMHSYGIAFDFDAGRNGLGDRTPEMAKHPKVIQAFKRHGAVWGGDWNGNGDTLDERRCDGMHFQFARLG